MSFKWIARAATAALATLAFTAAPATADRDEDRRNHRAEILIDEIFGGRVHNGGFRSNDDDDDWRRRNRGYGQDRGRRGGLVLFEDPGFRGQRFPINGQVNNLRRTGFNDTASSLRVRSGSWLVCTDPDFRGRCRVFTDDQSAFSRRGLNDRISSVRPIREREARQLARNGGFDNDFGFGNDRRDRDWRTNRGRDYDRDRRYGDNDLGIGRLGRHGNADLIVYKDPNGRGSALPVNGSISYLRSAGFNDTISSIEVRAGRWEICSDPDFRGRCRVIDRSIGYTRDIGLNDNISSIRRLDGSLRGRRNTDWRW
ncbi:MAG: beta/gamma crystallin-related protein [Pseudomonadota bacterium]